MEKSYLDDQISHIERRVYQAKHILVQKRNDMHGIINGRKLDPAEVQAQIDAASNLLETSREKLFELYNQKYHKQK